jgi:hypothetical protein
MQIVLIRAASIAALLLPPAAFAVDAMTPGLYEYTMKMSIPGGSANMPAQTMQRCLNAQDVDSSKAFQMPPGPGSDCKLSDVNQNGGQFSYKMSCTKPQKMDGAAQGSVTPTGMTMDITMTVDGIPGPMHQSITARRLGDCKP